MNSLDEVYANSTGPADYARRYASYLSQLLARLDAGAVERVIHLIMETRDEGKTLYFMGNGGSAASASHFANDFGVGPGVIIKPFRACSLTDNTAVLTCIANDIDFADVFRRQLQLQLTSGDLVVAISASGNSANVVRAVEYANACGNRTVGLTGFDGGRLRQICTECIHIATPGGEYGPVEDLHLILDHVMSSYIVRAVREAQGSDPSTRTHV